MSASVSCVVFAMRAPLGADAAGQQHEERDQREREQRELPVEQEHRDHRRHDRRHVRRDRGRGRGDDALDAADVVRDPRLHLAGARAREEREREPLQVAEHGGAQVVHHALADLVREQRLPDAERAVDDRDHDHPGSGERQRRRVRRLRVDRVQGVAQQERGNHAEDGREDDQREDRAEPQLVRHEQRPARRRVALRTAGSAVRSAARLIWKTRCPGIQPRVRIGGLGTPSSSWSAVPSASSSQSAPAGPISETLTGSPLAAPTPDGSATTGKPVQFQ